MEVAEEFVLFEVGLISLEWPTVLFVFVLFLTVVFSLNKLLFQPVLLTLAKRESLQKESENKEKEFDNSTGEAKAEYQTKLQEAQAEVLRNRGKADSEAAAETQKIIEEAKQATQAKFDEAANRIDGELKSEIVKANTHAKTISQAIIAKLSS